jgi:hypothetical protein
LESRGLLESLSKQESEEKARSGNENPGKMDWRDRVLPANYQREEIGPFPVYSQVFEERNGFQPNLSILDALFCCGKMQTIKLLQ